MDILNCFWDKNTVDKNPVSGNQQNLTHEKKALIAGVGLVAIATIFAVGSLLGAPVVPFVFAAAPVAIPLTYIFMASVYQSITAVKQNLVE